MDTVRTEKEEEGEEEEEEGEEEEGEEAEKGEKEEEGGREEEEFLSLYKVLLICFSPKPSQPQITDVL